MAIEMGNNNTTSVREDNVLEAEPMGSSSPDAMQEDSKTVENQFVSTAKADAVLEKSDIPGMSDVSDKIWDVQRQPEPEDPPTEALNIGEMEDKKNVTTLLSENLGHDGSSLRVEAEHQFEYKDLPNKTNGDPDLQTLVDIRDGVNETAASVERVNGICPALQLLENSSMKETEGASSVIIDSAREGPLRTSQEARKMDPENKEVSHEEVDQKENVPVSRPSPSPSDNWGVLEEKEEPRCSSRVLAGFVPGAIMESSRRTEEMDKDNEVSHHMENVLASRSSEFPDGEGGTPEEMKESRNCNVVSDFLPEVIPDASQKNDEMDPRNDVPHAEGVQKENLPVSLPSKLPDEDGIILEDVEAIKPGISEKVTEEESANAVVLKGPADEAKLALESEEPNHQAQCNGFIDYDCTKNDQTTSTDVVPSCFEVHKHCPIAENSFQADDGSNDVSREVVKGTEGEDENSSKEEDDVLPSKHELIEAPYNVSLDGKEAAVEFVPCAETKQSNDDESQSSASSDNANPNSEAVILDFEFEKPTADIAECVETCLGFKALKMENGYGNQSINSHFSGILIGEQEAEESTERFSSGRNSDRINSNDFPQMQKSPSFGLHVQPESDQTPLLFQDKTEIVIPITQEKAVTVVRSDSEESKFPLLRSTNQEENQQKFGTCDIRQKHDNSTVKETANARGKARRSLTSSLFGNCMCCGPAINN